MLGTLLVYTHMDNPNAYPPLGIVHLGTELKNIGVEVHLHDMTWDRDYENIRRKIRELRPGYVGLSTLSIAAGVSQEVGRIARESGVPRVGYGGAHACTGEHIGGLERHSGPYFFDPYLIPDRTLLPTMPIYLRQNPGFPYLMPWTYLIASRGCPFNCSFCQPMLRKLWGRRTIHRTVASVETEIEGMIKEYGLASYTFMDDTMISDETWLEELCKRIGKFKTPWTCQTNIRTVTWDRLKMMKEAGCYFVGMGVESGSEWINKHVYNKPQTKKQIKKAFEMCKRLDILTEATLIIGAPEDTRETVQETADLMKEVSPDVIDLHFLTPTPGSKLYDQYRTRGLYNGRDWRVCDRYTPGVLPGVLDRRQQTKLYWNVVRGWLAEKSLLQVKWFWWWRWFRGLRGFRARLEGVVRFLIYHSYFWHRVLKEGVWAWRRITGRR